MVNAEIMKSLKEKKTNEVPYFSLYIDTDHAQPENRKKRMILVEDFFKAEKEKAAAEGKHKKVLEVIDEIKDEVVHFLESAWNELTNGTVIFVGGDDHVFEVANLPKRIPSYFFSGEEFVLAPLAKYMETREDYLIVVMDTRGAKFYRYAHGDIEELTEMGNEFEDFLSGKRKKEKDIRGLMYTYVNELAKRIFDFKEKEKVSGIILFSPEKIAEALKEKMKAFGNFVKKLVVGNYTKTPKKSLYEKIDAVVLEIEDEKDREDLLSALSEIGNADYKKAVFGIRDVLKHVNANAIWKIIIDEKHDDFPPLYEDAYGVLYLSPEEAPEGAELKEVDFIDAITKRAFDNGAYVNYVPSDGEFSKIKDVEGILALVRFKV